MLIIIEFSQLEDMRSKELNIIIKSINFIKVNNKQFQISYCILSGYGAGGRSGIGEVESVSSPTLLESLQHVVIKKVAQLSGQTLTIINSEKLNQTQVCSQALFVIMSNGAKS